jgi:hypothetical protein
MYFSILFQSAGDGTPEDRERVRYGLIETLRLPAATVDQMLAQAPVTVRTRLTEEQARGYARALESVGAVVRILPTEMADRETPSGNPDPNLEWWRRFKVYAPEFTPDLQPVSPMTAATGILNGDRLMLGHPLVGSIAVTDIRLASVFKAGEGHWFIDLYGDNQTRPIRLDTEVVNFSSFGISETVPREEGVRLFLQYLHGQSRRLAVDLATFRFLRKAKDARTFPSLRATESYLARATADVLTPEAEKTLQLISHKDAEQLADEPDLWNQPPPEPPPIQAAPVFAPPQATYPVYPTYPPPPGQFPPPPTEQFPPPVIPGGGFLPPPPPRQFPPPPMYSQVPSRPSGPNYWEQSGDGFSTIASVSAFLVVGLQLSVLLFELSNVRRFQSPGLVYLIRILVMGCYCGTAFLIRAENTRGVYLFFLGLFFEFMLVSTGGIFLTIIFSGFLGMVIAAWGVNRMRS